jgi:hypothetical protein
MAKKAESNKRMSNEVKVGKGLRSLDLQGEREEGVQGHVRDAGPCGPRG